MRVRPASLSSVGPMISRGQLMAALCIFASSGGLLPRAIWSVVNEGWYDSIFNTFEISIVVWAAWASACYLALSADDRDRIRPLDIAVACGTLAIASLPMAHFSWLALSILSPYVYLSSEKRSALRRSAIIFFGICAPMLWGPALLALAAPLLLKIDAFFVATLTGADRSGNVVSFIGQGSGAAFIEDVRGIQIWAPCSSFHNISQAALAWVALTQTLGRDLEIKDLFWCAFAMFLAGSVNLARLSLMTISPEYYVTIHGPIGAQVAGGLTITLIAFVCILGQRRELFARV